jgi:hypothetical protein
MTGAAKRPNNAAAMSDLSLRTRFEGRQGDNADAQVRLWHSGRQRDR